MKTIRALWARLVAVVSRSERDADLAEELDSHLQLHVDDNLRLGMNEAEARRNAMLKLGGLEQTKEYCRDRYQFLLFETILKDIRFGARRLRRDRLLLATAVLSLGVGIGLNTALFGVIDSVLLRPFPYPKPDQLVLIWGNKSRDIRSGVPARALYSVGERSQAFEGISPIQLNSFPFYLGAKQEDRIEGGYVGTNTFALLQVKPFLGRTFSDSDNEPGHESVVILSYSAWQGYFDGDPLAVGRTVLLNEKLYTVVGVMAQDFFFPDETFKLWVPLTSETPGFESAHGLARVRQGLTYVEAESKLNSAWALNNPLRSTGEKDSGWGVFSLYSVIVGPHERALWLLLGAVSLLVLIACANVSNLLLTRSIGRQKEFAVRLTLGCGSKRLLQLVLIEGVLLSLCAGVFGIAVAYVSLSLLKGLSLTDIPRFDRAEINSSVLGFAFALSLICGVVSSFLPAVRTLSTELKQGLYPAGLSTSAPRRSQTRDLVVSLAVAISLSLLLECGLLVNSFVRISRADWGFNPDGLLLVDVTPAGKIPRPVDSDIAFTNKICQLFSLVPGVASVSMALGVPLDYSYGGTNLTVDGKFVTTDWHAQVWAVAPDYFRTMGIPLLHGREFQPTDNSSSERVVVINRALSDRLWPNQLPVQKHFQTMTMRPELARSMLERIQKNNHLATASDISLLSDARSYVADPEAWTVVGEVGNVRAFGLDSGAEPAAFFDYRQQVRITPANLKFVVRSSIDPTKLVPSIRQTIREVAPDSRTNFVVPMSNLVEQSIGGRGSNKLMLVISLLFGGLSLMLAGVGIFSWTAFSVYQRTKEIGIRLAMGAQRGQILRVITLSGMRAILFGLALGSVLAFASARLLKKFLFGVSSTDPLTFFLSVAVLVAAALVGMLLPTLRALKISPLDALRDE